MSAASAAEVPICSSDTNFQCGRAIERTPDAKAMHHICLRNSLGAYDFAIFELATTQPAYWRLALRGGAKIRRAQRSVHEKFARALSDECFGCGLPRAPRCEDRQDHRSRC